jgi:hypothetical protein
MVTAVIQIVWWRIRMRDQYAECNVADIVENHRFVRGGCSKRLALTASWSIATTVGLRPSRIGQALCRDAGSATPVRRLRAEPVACRAPARSLRGSRTSPSPWRCSTVLSTSRFEAANNRGCPWSTFLSQRSGIYLRCDRYIDRLRSASVNLSVAKRTIP